MIPEYRAYNKRLKKMQKVLEIYLDPELGGVSVWGKSSIDYLTGEHEAAQDFWPWEDIALMQRINFENKPQKDIYEGNILVLVGEKLHYQVYWNDDRWGLKDYRGDDYDSGDYYRGDDINNWHEWEAIGNIYENPALLEKQA